MGAPGLGTTLPHTAGEWFSEATELAASLSTGGTVSAQCERNLKFLQVLDVSGSQYSQHGESAPISPAAGPNLCSSVSFFVTEIAVITRGIDEDLILTGASL